MCVQGQHKKMAERRRRQTSRALYREIQQLLAMAGGQSRVCLLQALLCRLLPPCAASGQAAGLRSITAPSITPQADAAGVVPKRDDASQEHKNVPDGDKANVEVNDAHDIAAQLVGPEPVQGECILTGDCLGKAVVQGSEAVVQGSIISVSVSFPLTGETREDQGASNKRMLRERRGRRVARSVLAALVSAPAASSYTPLLLPAPCFAVISFLSTCAYGARRWCNCRSVSPLH